MTDNTQPEAGSTHIIRYALEMGLLWIDGDGRDKVREALDALDTLEAQLEAIGAGGVSGPLLGRAADHFRGVTKMVAPARPVAWLVYLPSEDAQRIYDSQDDIGYVDDLTNNADAKVIPLYTAQPSAAAAAQPPAGWVLVPVEPTVSMRDAMWIGTGMRVSETRLAYSAMLAAAPKAEPVLADEYPAGAIVNGRAHIDRLESLYNFECEAGPLYICDDWEGLKSCFEHLADHAAAQAAPAAESGLAIADARRIAALPELLGAADNALGVLIASVIPAGGADDKAAILGAQRQLRAAIAKVTGNDA